MVSKAHLHQLTVSKRARKCGGGLLIGGGEAYNQTKKSVSK